MATGGQYPSTKETTNYARLCRLLTDVCADVLREVIANYIPLPQLPQSLVANKIKLLKVKVLNPSQKQLLYPYVPCCPTYGLMDISLLYVLIRNICPSIPAPKEGWGRDPVSRANDNSLASNVERIRMERNELSGHLMTASVSDQVFQQHWQTIEDTLVAIEASDLGGGTRYKDAMDDLLQQFIDPEMEECINELRRIEEADLETKQLVETYGEQQVKLLKILQEQVQVIGQKLEKQGHDVGGNVREDIRGVGAQVHDVGENLSAVRGDVRDIDENVKALAIDVQKMREDRTVDVKEMKDDITSSVKDETRSVAAKFDAVQTVLEETKEETKQTGSTIRRLETSLKTSEVKEMKDDITSSVKDETRSVAAKFEGAVSLALFGLAQRTGELTYRNVP